MSHASIRAYRGYGAPRRDRLNDLDCQFCGGWFKNFTELSAHVTHDHKKEIARYEDQQTHDAGTYTFNNGENDVNIPASTQANARKSKTSKNASGRIPGSSREQSNDYNPFLKPADIGGIGSSAKLVFTGVARMSSGTYGDQIIAEVKLGRVLYDWSFKLNSPNHREIEERFGLNPAKWRNKVFVVGVKEHMDREYIAVLRERESTAPRAARKAKATKRKSAKR